MTVRELIAELEKYDGDTPVHIDPLGLQEGDYAFAVRSGVCTGLHPADGPFEGIVISGLWRSGRRNEQAKAVAVEIPAAQENAESPL